MNPAVVTEVKGSMFVRFVRSIKADKSGRCEYLLTDEAKKVAKSIILATKWYPFSVYKSCFQAVCHVYIKSDPEAMRKWGRVYGEETMTALYGMVFVKKDAQTAMDAFRDIAANVYDSVRIESEMISENEVEITVTEFDPDFEEWYRVGQGWIERTIELVIKKDVTSRIIKHSWLGDPATVYRMSW